MRRLLLVAVLTLTACSTAPETPGPDATALPERCHLEAKALMRAALAKDGNLDGLPKTSDRSLGIPACKGLSSEDLDRIAGLLQEELRPDILDAGMRASATP